jgi:branched-chain amino acid transport system ATP-binding protein
VSDALLELSEIRSAYGPIEVLKGVSLSVAKGEMVAVIGANGAGKSTTLRVASRIQPITHGRILFSGVDVTDTPAHDLVGMGLVQVPEGRRIFPRLTVRENLEMGAFLRKDSLKPDLDRVFTLFPILKERQTQSGGTLSGGEQQMLAIARSIMTRPKILLLDEPSMGVAPLLTARIFETIRALNTEGMTILLVEQNAHLALKVASRAYVLETGTVILEGPSALVATDCRVKEAYLGG